MAPASPALAPPLHPEGFSVSQIFVQEPDSRRLKQQQQKEEERNNGRGRSPPHPRAARGPSLLTIVGSAFLAFNAAAAVYSADRGLGAVSFAAFSGLDLLLLLYCLRLHGRAPPGSSRREHSRWRRGGSPPRSPSPSGRCSTSASQSRLRIRAWPSPRVLRICRQSHDHA
ncbi:uncharacterized protein C2845_PM11G00050 [Panicum miliaceum]|uniref:Uncharacterized protein n=1 Tax=Panicum miliaceum TaxID=4540 RepID=A0A3L6RY33_PANMI|nr:uncharacterized protein C2845_PM11G00050 [Panicum miliaceum]